LTKTIVDEANRIASEIAAAGTADIVDGLTAAINALVDTHLPATLKKTALIKAQTDRKTDLT